VHTCDDRIDGDHELAVGSRIEHRGVVADSQPHIGTRRLLREITSDEFEFA
jgi:hypothetical protein